MLPISSQGGGQFQVVEVYQRFQKYEGELEEARGTLPPLITSIHLSVPLIAVGLVVAMARDSAGDREMEEMAAEEAKRLSEEVASLEQQLTVRPPPSPSPLHSHFLHHVIL